MASRLSAEELAARAGTTPERVADLAGRGLLHPEAGSFPAADVHLVRLIDALETAGVDLGHVARGIETGEISFADFGYLGEPPGVASTAEELGAALGRDPAVVRRLLAAAGLPPPAGPLREDDADLVLELARVFDVAQDDELERVVRLFGDAGRRLAQAVRRFYSTSVQERVLASDRPAGEKAAILQEKAEDAVGLADRLVRWAHGRHLEREIFEFITESVEAYLDERGVAPARRPRPPAIAFLDLSGFTALTEERGDEVAAAVAAELAGVVQDAAREQGGEAVKWLGDGVMFHFPDAAAAVGSALDLVERVPRAVQVPARVGVNAGPVVFQDGDYFGRTVNVAARIADYARPREVLVSQEAVDGAEHGGVAFERIGEVTLKGVARPVTLHRASAG